MALTTIIISQLEFSKNTIVGGNVDWDKIVPAIKAVQQTKIKRLLGKTLYDKICLDNKNGSLTGLYSELYDDYVKMMVIHGSCELFLSTGAYLVTNNGITKAKTESSETISKEEVDFMVEASRSLYMSYESDLLTWLETNGSNIPELTADNNSVVINSRKMIVGGWLVNRIPKTDCNTNDCGDIDCNSCN